jgi:hypothetical protein
MVSFEMKQTPARDRATAASLESEPGVVRFIGRSRAGFPFAARYVVINLIGLALIAAAWAENLLFKPFVADHSGMSYLIAALFLAGMVAVARRDWQTVRWAGNALVYLGMVGTVLGLIMTVSNLTSANAQRASSWSCVTWTKVPPSLRCRWRSSSCIWRRILTSRAPSGSSAGRSRCFSPAP